VIKNSVLKYFFVVCALMAVQFPLASLSHNQKTTKRDARGPQGRRNFFKKNKSALISLSAVIVGAAVIGGYAYWHRKQQIQRAAATGPLVDGSGSGSVGPRSDGLSPQQFEERLLGKLNQSSNDFLGTDGNCYFRNGRVVIGNCYSESMANGSMWVGSPRSAGRWSEHLSIRGLKILINESVDFCVNHALSAGRLSRREVISSVFLEWFFKVLCPYLCLDPSSVSYLQNMILRLKVTPNDIALHLKAFCWNYFIAAWFLYTSDKSDTAWRQLYNMYQTWPEGGHPIAWEFEEFKRNFQQILNASTPNSENDFLWVFTTGQQLDDQRTQIPLSNTRIGWDIE